LTETNVRPDPSQRSNDHDPFFEKDRRLVCRELCGPHWHPCDATQRDSNTASNYDAPGGLCAASHPLKLPVAVR